VGSPTTKSAVSESLTAERLKRPVLIVASIIFLAIIVVSLVLAFSTPISLPSASSSGPTPYVLAEVVELASTTYTTTITTTPVLHVIVGIHPEVLIMINGTGTYTTATNVTTTITTWY
jgi:hypothetical protein